MTTVKPALAGQTSFTTDREKQMKKLAALALLAVTALVVAGCGSSSKTVTQTVTAPSENDEAEGSNGAAEEESEEPTKPTATEIPDGVWQVGRDYTTGLYRAPGGGSCYWALLKKANPNSIIENGGNASTQTLEITSPFFETTGCGVWEKIG